MRTTLFHPSRPIVGRAAAILALVAQLALLVACIGEGRSGVGYASHIDPAGTAKHYVHNEAVCAACQARSLHGVVRPAHPPTIATIPRQTAPVDRLQSFLGSTIDRHNLSRAPPPTLVG
ncbi:MAG TPA: hypothetical protein VGJ18_13360 [Gemmatimonadaceae bacterium]|jgi:hypothetical protein